MNVAIKIASRQPRPAWAPIQYRFDFVNDGAVVGKTRYGANENEALVLARAVAKRRGWTIVNLTGWTKLRPIQRLTVPDGVRWCPGGDHAMATDPAVAKLRADTSVVKWSGASATPPAVGDIVHVRINSIGRSKVLGYFVEDGWMGVQVLPFDPPEWSVRQNGLRDLGVFGNEIRVLP